MRRFALALLLGALLLPGLAAAQYYLDLDITCDTPEVPQGGEACFTVSWDHNLTGIHPGTLEVWITMPNGNEYFQGVYDVEIKWCGPQDRSDCLMVPLCAPLGDYEICVYLYGENGYLADTACCTFTVVDGDDYINP